jgi:single-stranded-DNA-specific exonuclease
MHRPKRWNIAPPHQAADELAGRLKASPLLAQVLLNRGISDPAECAAFLRPSLKHLHEPFAIANLRKAAERIARAIRDQEKIVIYGDYDVDGITATAILWHAITLLGGSPDFYIPHRIEEGYGLNAEAIAQICEQGAKLIITVDCGVTAIEQARVACDRGVDLIITDHHEWKEHVGSASADEIVGLPVADGAPEIPSAEADPTPILPDCYTLVHPRLGAYPNAHLCGAGVAFKLAWGVGLINSGGDRVSEEFRNFLVEATALAALGTIADVVPLVGENRVLAHFGLGGLKETRIRGLLALIASAGLTGQKLDSYDVGFKLAPRLNACGRLGHARLAVEMLTKASESQALEIATYLEQQNRTRQAMEKQILDAALEQVKQHALDDDGCHGIVLGAEGWHAGVIGIVASRIVDRFHRPTIMVSLTNGHGQGSGRSIAGFHLTRALGACRDFLETFGGHEMAAGLKLKTERFADFREAFAAHAKIALAPECLTPELPLECLATLRQMTIALVTDLQRLGPFGHANRKPLLAVRDLEVCQPPRVVGNGGQHLQLQVRDATGSLKCIAFGFGGMADQLPIGTKLELAVEPIINEYNGRTSVELGVKDLRIVS